MALTGEPLAAPAALDHGLIVRMTEPGQALDTAMELAAAIVRNAPLGVEAVKRSAAPRTGPVRGGAVAHAAARIGRSAVFHSDDAWRAPAPSRKGARRNGAAGEHSAARGQKGMIGMRGDRYRVVQWATGNIGLRSLRAVIEHPDLELVGLYVYSETRPGRTPGSSAAWRRPACWPPGTSTRSSPSQPDCVLYMGDRADIDVMCQLLEAGANVVSTRSEFHNPAGLDPEVRARLEDACARGASLHSAPGSSPGFITEALPLVLTVAAAPPRPPR